MLLQRDQTVSNGKLSFTCCIFFSILAAGFCQTQGSGFKENSPVSQSFRYALGRNNGTGFEPFRTTAQFLYTFEVPSADVSAGMQMTSATFDFTSEGIWWFARGTRIRTGTGLVYHYLLLDNISATNDFMLSMYMQIRPFRPLMVDLNAGIQYKIDQVFAVKEEIPWLQNCNPAFRIRLCCMLGQSELYSEIASYETFRYMLFLAPSFTFGALYRWPDGVWAGTELCVRYTDMMTLSAYYDSTEIRAYLGLRF